MKKKKGNRKDLSVQRSKNERKEKKKKKKEKDIDGKRNL